MNNRKFRILCNGNFRGFIFISNYQGNYESKIATIAPFSLEKNDEGDSEIKGLQHIVDLYLPEISDENIITDLLSRVVFDNCLKMEIIPMH